MSPHAHLLPAVFFFFFFPSLICFDSLVSAKKRWAPWATVPGADCSAQTGSIPSDSGGRPWLPLSPPPPAQPASTAESPTGRRVKCPCPDARTGIPETTQLRSVPVSPPELCAPDGGGYAAPQTALGTGASGEGRVGMPGRALFLPAAARHARPCPRLPGGGALQGECRPPGRGAAGHRRIKAGVVPRCASSARLGSVRGGATPTAT